MRLGALRFEMTESILFEPLQIGNIKVPNRIAVAPMCQYMANDGCATAWHTQHLMSLAMSGAGLVMIEATAVSREGRITHGCLGLYSDANEDALGEILYQARRVALPGTEFGIQLSHAGRKGSAHRPWEAPGGSLTGSEAWRTIAPSAIAHRAGWHLPQAASEADLDKIAEDFRQAAVRAKRLGIKVLEIHLAHGYLLHQFHSPLSNSRQDAWGGDDVRRMAFPLRIARSVRQVGDDVAVGARITGSDWSEEGLTVGDAITIAGQLKDIGIDYACVTSGGIPVDHPTNSNPEAEHPALASAIKNETGLVTRAVGMITSSVQANELIAAGFADQVAIGRGFLDNPRWGWHAAHDLSVEIPTLPLTPGLLQRNGAALNEEALSRARGKRHLA